MTYRATPVAATGRSPAMMMTRREMKTLLPCLQRNLYPKSHPDVRTETRDTKQLINGTSISTGSRSFVKPTTGCSRPSQKGWRKDVENNRNCATTMQHPNIISCGDRPRRCAGEKQETPTGDTGKACTNGRDSVERIGVPGSRRTSR